MHAAMLHGPGDVRLEHRPDPILIDPTDAIIRTSATCVCGTDLWDYRGPASAGAPKPFGHEYCGVVEEVGSEVTAVKPGQFVIGSFVASDNTCVNCRNGVHTSCRNGVFMTGCQAEAIRVPLADGTLVATPDMPSAEMIPSLLTLSDVMGTGWFAADAANVQPGMTVAVVGDGAVGLCGILAAVQRGAERVIAMSRHEPRQQLARAFGATDVVSERGDEGVARIKELTNGVGADAVLECVGTDEAMRQATRSTRPGGVVGFVGLPHGVSLDGTKLFFSHVGIRGGAAPVRYYLPHLIDLVYAGSIDPGRVFDMTLPLGEVATAYKAMDARRAVKVLLTL